MNMRYFFLGFFCTWLVHQGYAQAQLLGEEQLQNRFSSKLQKELGITFPITKAYTYQDKEGNHFWLFTENKLYETSKNKGQV